MTVEARGTTYTPPANGYYQAGGVGDYFSIYDLTNGMTTMSFNKNYQRGFIPVKKGRAIRLDYSNFTFDTFRFIYASSSRSIIKY